MTAEQEIRDFDFTDPDVNWSAVPHDRFRELRRTTPVAWIEQQPGSYDGFAPESGSGYWAVTGHADVAAVSKDSKRFSNAENGAIIRFPEGMEREMVEMQRVMILNQDPPEHTAMRHIVSRAFTPRSIAQLEQIMRDRAHRIVTEAVERGSGDFVEEVAAELPLQAIADLLGVPQEDRKKLFHWSNQMLANEDPDFAEVDGQEAAAEVLMYAMAMAADRKAAPRDDIVTRLLEADKDGRGLNDDEFGYFVIILAVAGNETTRNAISHGMNAFLDNPDQWELWKRERPGHDDRRGRPVGDAGHRLPAHRARGPRGRGSAGAEGPAGRHLLRVRELRRGGLRRPLHLRHPARPQPARGVRWPRRALLPRRQPGAPGDPADLRRTRGSRSRHLQGRRAETAAARVDQRDQGTASRLHGRRLMALPCCL